MQLLLWSWLTPVPGIYSTLCFCIKSYVGGRVHKKEGETYGLLPNPPILPLLTYRVSNRLCFDMEFIYIRTTVDLPEADFYLNSQDIFDFETKIVGKAPDYENCWRCAIKENINFNTLRISGRKWGRQSQCFKDFQINILLKKFILQIIKHLLNSVVNL